MKEKKLVYEAPKVITYSEDEIVEMLGPARACFTKPVSNVSINRNVYLVGQKDCNEYQLKGLNRGRTHEEIFTSSGNYILCSRIPQATIIIDDFTNGTPNNDLTIGPGTNPTGDLPAASHWSTCKHHGWHM